MKKIIIEGRNAVHDALLSDRHIEKLFVSQKSLKDPKIKETMTIARNQAIPVMITTPEHIKSIGESKNVQGILAYMQYFEYSSLVEILDTNEKKSKDSTILLLNRIDYEQNLGAIMRSSWGAGIDAVVVNPHGVHEITPVVAKVSQGGAAYVPLISQSLFQAMKVLKERGIPIVGVDMNAGTCYTDLTLLGSVAFVLGGEDSGISDPIKKYCDIFIHIPMIGNLSSLNVSVATALILFEKRRQEREAEKLI